MSNGQRSEISNIGDFTPHVVPWPRSIGTAGYYGLAGEFVRLVEPHTEADPNAILLTFLTFAGQLLGRNFYVMAGSDEHHGNLFLCLIGTTGHGRKGSAISVVNSFFHRGPEPPRLGHVLKGISTGEGVVWEIHDDLYKMILDKKTGKPERTLVEPAEPEKRLLIVLNEFQQCLANMRKPESILSSILRQAWDQGELSTPAKNSRAIATGAHVSVAAAMSKTELLAETDTTDAENGTLNRFMFACSKRSKLLPQGGQFSKLFSDPHWISLQQRINQNTENGHGRIEIHRSQLAEENWGLNENPDRGMYRILNQSRPGIWGAVTARAPQIVLRLANIIAVINGAREISEEHLDAAYECWRYCDESARYVFGDRLDDPLAARVMQELRSAAPQGLTRSQLHRLFLNHGGGREKLDAALLWLAHSGIAHCEKIQTQGRPVETWYENA